jgi:hypothetical protein
MLPTPPEIQSEFEPYIYTGEQVLTLLRTTRLSQQQDACLNDAETFRIDRALSVLRAGLDIRALAFLDYA